MPRPLHLWQGSKADTLCVIEHLNGEYDWRPKGRQIMSAGQVRAVLSLSSPFREAENQRRKLLKEWVDSWLAADCDFETWQAGDPHGLFTRLQNHVKSAKYILTPGRDGRANIAAQWLLRTHPLDEFLAAEDFLQLITSPFHNSVRVCRRTNCGRYFLSTPRKTAYCTADCATHATAVLSTRERRKKELQAKLGKAQRELDKLREYGLAHADWRRKAAERAGVSLRFLTRHINARHLKVPLALTTRKGETQ